LGADVVSVCRQPIKLLLSLFARKIPPSGKQTLGPFSTPLLRPGRRTFSQRNQFSHSFAAGKIRSAFLSAKRFQSLFDLSRTAQKKNELKFLVPEKFFASDGDIRE
jgi:hypothetical protein